MSFTSTVKDEISSLELTKAESVAELSGFLRSSTLNKELELLTENAKIAKRIYLLLKTFYGVELEIVQKKVANFTRKKTYNVVVKEGMTKLLRELSVLDDNGNYIESPGEYIIGSDEEIRAYLRGTFLSKGRINDPKTSQYHLEFVYDNKYEAVVVQRLLNGYDLNSKIIIRDLKYMVYIKESEKISDFLKVIRAFKAVLYYENIRAYKEQKNNTNRLNNCEQANVDKVVETGLEQIKDIELIQEILGLEMLADKLREACEYRLKYPDSSLTELSNIISLETGKKLTKSGLNHRFRKIREIANELSKK